MCCNRFFINFVLIIFFFTIICTYLFSDITVHQILGKSHIFSARTIASHVLIGNGIAFSMKLYFEYGQEQLRKGVIAKH